MDAKILSARLVQPEKADLMSVNDIMGIPKLEVTTEKVVTETRTYEREFLERQKATIEADIVYYLECRNKELAEIDELLKQFDTLTKEGVIADVKI